MPRAGPTRPKGRSVVVYAGSEDLRQSIRRQSQPIHGMEVWKWVAAEYEAHAGVRYAAMCCVQLCTLVTSGGKHKMMRNSSCNLSAYVESHPPCTNFTQSKVGIQMMIDIAIEI